MMTIKIITDCPALFVSDKKILVITDLHLGLEYELYKSGIIISPQAKKFQKILDKLIKMTKAETLIILGDIKHEVPGISYREEKEIPKLFNYLTERVQVICCKGNHDTHLHEILPKGVKIYSSRGFKLGVYGFFHGHAWPSKKLMRCDYLFMGHIHPAVEFKDKFGYRFLEHVWIKGKLNKELVKKKYKIKKTGKLQTIILPAFNKLLGGVAVNLAADEELIGPLLANKFFDINKSKAYLLDGTFLGDIKKLTTLV